VKSWISTIDVTAGHEVTRRRLGAKHHGSGQWLLTREDFNEWKRPGSGVVWLQGAMGTGKSCLSSVVIEHLTEEIKSRPTARVGYFYCVDKSDPDAMLRSLLSQLCVSKDGREVHPMVVKKWKEKGQGQVQTLSRMEYIVLLTECLNSNEQTFFVIDGLDECSQPTDFLEELAGIYDTTQNIAVYLSSRHGIPIKNYFDSVQLLPVVPENTSKDIKAYIEREVEDRQRRRLGCVTISQAETLSGLLIAKAGGMYVYILPT
jgi:hypothetical protein